MVNGVEQQGVTAVHATRAPRVTVPPLHAARIGLYKSWVANIDEGWTRWVLEQYGFPYTTLTDADVRAGRLRDRFDVVILPVAVTARASSNGHRRPAAPSTSGAMEPRAAGVPRRNWRRRRRRAEVVRAGRRAADHLRRRQRSRPRAIRRRLQPHPQPDHGARREDVLLPGVGAEARRGRQCAGRLRHDAIGRGLLRRLARVRNRRPVGRRASRAMRLLASC